MAYFALLWKARTIEKYRRNYESEKINSIMMSNTQMPKQSLSQRWKHYRYDAQKRISRTFKKWYPEGTSVSNFFLYLKTDQTCPKFVLKSTLGFLGGIVLTYLCFMFFVFQLSISLIHATIMSSIIGVLLTLGLAFSYRIRCLVFLLIPQFFSRVGRYSLTCYALVLILTGPATNTLRNSEVLSESLACGQEQIKSSVNQINSLMTKPLNCMKNSIKLMIDRLRQVAVKVKHVTVKINRLVRNIAQVIQSSFIWLNTFTKICNEKFNVPYQRCIKSLKGGIKNCKSVTNRDRPILCNNKRAEEICSKLKSNLICVLIEHVNGDIVPVIKKRLKNFSDRITQMFSMQVHIHHSYSFSSNTSRSASQVAAGIVTEIRRRADPLLTWLSWSSCVTSLFLLLIIFRAKYYQHMFETRSRFDNRYITKEIRDLDLKRLREGRETILPLNKRERAKFVTTTSFRLVASEKLYLNRSVVFMTITTFKLLIHIVADYSLYWVLMTMQYHGKFQTLIHPGPPNAGMHISSSGPTSDLLKSILSSLGVLLESPSATTETCLPDPSPPDLKRYTQIGILILLLWFFAMFEPYGLRMRHVIMNHYQPERAKARALWLYNHILRTRGGFMKFARRKLHRTYKYRTEEKYTFQRWLHRFIPFSCLRSLFGTGPEELHCLLCGTTNYDSPLTMKLIRCKSSNCPGIYCASCFSDIGELCTICLSPKDYGDLSDVSLEKGSSEESDDDDDDEVSKQNSRKFDNVTNLSMYETEDSHDTFSRRAIKEYKIGMSRNSKNELEMRPLLFKTNQRSGDIVDDNEAVILIENPVKKGTLIRHRNYSRTVQQCTRNKRKSNCKYCRDDRENSFKRYNRLVDAIDASYFTSITVNAFPETNQNINNHKGAKDQPLNNENKRNKHCNHDDGTDNKNSKQSDQSKKNRNTPKATNVITKKVSKRILKTSCYNISLNKKEVQIQKKVEPTRKSKKNKKSGKIFAKSRKRQKAVKLDNSTTVLNCRNKLRTNFVTYSCHCGCKNHDDIIDESRLYKRKRNSAKGKDTNENTAKPSDTTCVCIKKILSVFSDIWRSVQTVAGFLTFNNNSIKNSTQSGEKKNLIRKKKKKCTESTQVDMLLKCDKLSSDDSRDYRISAYLAEQDWMKRQCRSGIYKGRKKNCGDAEVSEALAIIKSRSKNLAKDRKNRSDVNKDVKKTKSYQETLPVLNSSLKNDKKRYEAVLSEVWKKIGYGFISDSSSSSFIKHVFKKTADRVYANKAKKAGLGPIPKLRGYLECPSSLVNNCSSDGSRRMKFYESLGNDDFEKNANNRYSKDSSNLSTSVIMEGLKLRKNPHRRDFHHLIDVISNDNPIAKVRNVEDHKQFLTHIFQGNNFIKKLKRFTGCASSMAKLKKSLCRIKSLKSIIGKCHPSFRSFSTVCRKDGRTKSITKKEGKCDPDCKTFNGKEKVKENIPKPIVEDKCGVGCKTDKSPAPAIVKRGVCSEVIAKGGGKCFPSDKSIVTMDKKADSQIPMTKEEGKSGVTCLPPSSINKTEECLVPVSKEDGNCDAICKPIMELAKKEQNANVEGKCEEICKKLKGPSVEKNRKDVSRCISNREEKKQESCVKSDKVPNTENCSLKVILPNDGKCPDNCSVLIKPNVESCTATVNKEETCPRSRSIQVKSTTENRGKCSESCINHSVKSKGKCSVSCTKHSVKSKEICPRTSTYIKECSLENKDVIKPNKEQNVICGCDSVAKKERAGKCSESCTKHSLKGKEKCPGSCYAHFKNCENKDVIPPDNPYLVSHSGCDSNTRRDKTGNCSGSCMKHTGISKDADKKASEIICGCDKITKSTKGQCWDSCTPYPKRNSTMVKKDLCSTIKRKISEVICGCDCISKPNVEAKCPQTCAMFFKGKEEGGKVLKKKSEDIICGCDDVTSTERKEFTTLAAKVKSSTQCPPDCEFAKPKEIARAASIRMFLKNPPVPNPPSNLGCSPDCTKVRVEEKTRATNTSKVFQVEKPSGHTDANTGSNTIVTPVLKKKSEEIICGCDDVTSTERKVITRGISSPVRQNTSTNVGCSPDCTAYKRNEIKNIPKRNVSEMTKSYPSSANAQTGTDRVIYSGACDNEEVTRIIITTNVSRGLCTANTIDAKTGSEETCSPGCKIPKHKGIPRVPSVHKVSRGFSASPIDEHTGPDPWCLPECQGTKKGEPIGDSKPSSKEIMKMSLNSSRSKMSQAKMVKISDIPAREVSTHSRGTMKRPVFPDDYDHVPKKDESVMTTADKIVESKPSRSVGMLATSAIKSIKSKLSRSIGIMKKPTDKGVVPKPSKSVGIIKTPTDGTLRSKPSKSVGIIDAPVAAEETPPKENSQEESIPDQTTTEETGSEKSPAKEDAPLKEETVEVAKEKSKSDKSTLVFSTKKSASKTSEKSTMIAPAKSTASKKSDKSTMISPAPEKSSTVKQASEKTPSAMEKSLRSIAAKSLSKKIEPVVSSDKTEEPVTPLEKKEESLAPLEKKEESVAPLEKKEESVAPLEKTPEPLAPLEKSPMEVPEEFPALCGACRELLEQLNKALQVRDPSRRQKNKSAQSGVSRVQTMDSKSSSEESKSSSNDVESEENCPCNGKCSDPETGEIRICTCATQYMYSEDDSSGQMRLLREFINEPNDELEREIYDYTTGSCSGSETILSSSIDTDPEPDSYCDSTICNMAFIDDRQRKMRRNNVITKANRCTSTEQPKVCDVSTLTQDWWSPIVEKRKVTKEIRFDKTVKENGREIRFDISLTEMGRELSFDGKRIVLEKKDGDHTMGDQIRETKKRSKVTKTDGKSVKFRSQAQIIPPGADDILSPSRYLLESQRYYNELFSSKFYAPHLFPVNLIQKPSKASNNISSSRLQQSRRNYKTKRLEECYSPRKQIISPRRRMVYEWTRANDKEAIKWYDRKKIQRSNTKTDTSSFKRSLRHNVTLRVDLNEGK